jgi:hypothetical protein
MHYKPMYWPNILHCKLYVIYDVYVLTNNTWSKKALCDTKVMTYIDYYMFRHGGATLRESL